MAVKPHFLFSPLSVPRTGSAKGLWILPAGGCGLLEVVVGGTNSASPALRPLLRQKSHSGARGPACWLAVGPVNLGSVERIHVWSGTPGGRESGARGGRAEGLCPLENEIFWK